MHLDKLPESKSEEIMIGSKLNMFYCGLQLRSLSTGSVYELAVDCFS